MNYYNIVQRMSRWGKLSVYDVYVNGEGVGTINPLFKSLESNRPYAYQTDVWLEDDWLADDSGYPNEYKTAREAKDAISVLMERNGISEIMMN